jgi:purine catabolism regulator
VRPTLRSVLASPAVRAGAPEVLAGEVRLDVPVRWVHVGEVRELAGLLRGGELILTTGLAMSGPGREAVGYVEGLVGAGAAGLVVELGETLPSVPEPVLRAARAHQFPLVALHRRVRFVEITEEVHRRIVAEQLEEVEFARSVHETFTRLSLEAADVASIVRTAAELCDSSVVLEDLARHVVAFEARHRPAAGLLADWEARSRRVPALESTGIAGPEGWLTSPVGRTGNRWGRLVVPHARASQTRLALVLERGAQALELGRMVERDRTSLALQAQGGLLADRAAGRLPDEETARARAASLGLRTAPRYVGVVARAASPPASPPAEPAGVDPVAEHAVSRALVERLSAAVRAAGASGLVGPLPGASGPQAGLLLAVPPAGDGSAADESGVLDALADTLGGGLVLGVGPAGRGLLGAGAGLRLAAHVAEVAATMPGALGARPYYRSGDVRLHGLLALLHDDPRVQAFAESELAPLLDHEARLGGGLLELLRQFVAAGGNKTRLAASAHRSRPAVYKKLARIERILGVDLDEPGSFLAVSVALLAHDQGQAAARSGSAQAWSSPGSRP